MKKIEWTKGKKRDLIMFVVLFIFFSIWNYIFDYVVRPSEIDLLRETSVALGCAIPCSFFFWEIIGKVKDL